MAKKSMVARENKRARTVAKYAAKRAKLKETIADVLMRMMTRAGKRRLQLQKLPRNASPSAPARRCQITGAHTAFTESLVCAETSYVKLLCAVMYRAWLSQAGNGDERL